MKFKRVKWSPGWCRIEDVAHKNGWQIEIGHCPGAPLPYGVHFAGNGHYFKTLPDAYAYCRGRKWIPAPETIQMGEDCRRVEDWTLVEAVRREKGRNVDILYSETAESPYCVVSKGRYYPFASIYEARAFCFGRGWLGNSSKIYGEGRNAV